MSTSDEPLRLPCAYELLSSGGSSAGRGRLVADTSALSVEPEAGAPVSLRWHEIEAVQEENYVIGLALFGGARLTVSRLGPRHDEALETILQSRVTALGEALLITEPSCEAAFACHTPQGPALTSLYESRLAVFPQTGLPLVIEYADLAQTRFDAPAHEVVLIERGGRDTRLAKLGARTDEFIARAGACSQAHSLLITQSASAVLPSLAGQDAHSVAGALLRQGSVRRDQVATDVWNALVSACCPDEAAREYAAQLAALSQADSLCVGLTPVTWEGYSGALPGPMTPDGRETRLIGWLLAPLATGGEVRAAAFEVTSESDTATYGFRIMPGSADDEFAQLHRCLRRIQFRREPITDAGPALIGGRYGLAATHLPELAWLRERFLGRALHTSLDAWSRTVTAFA